mmetsp:Transcript_16827/g.23635  ORF Transcript_16827/g.23635 Transcript_16827/m.23635 type:complete len:224 (-) Transcript_16827:519-1190(-)
MQLQIVLLIFSVFYLLQHHIHESIENRWSRYVLMDPVVNFAAGDSLVVLQRCCKVAHQRIRDDRVHVVVQAGDDTSYLSTVRDVPARVLHQQRIHHMLAGGHQELVVFRQPVLHHTLVDFFDGLNHNLRDALFQFDLDHLVEGSVHEDTNSGFVADRLDVRPQQRPQDAVCFVVYQVGVCHLVDRFFDQLWSAVFDALVNDRVSYFCYQIPRCFSPRVCPQRT